MKDLSISLDRPRGGQWSSMSGSRSEDYPNFGVDTSHQNSARNSNQEKTDQPSALAIAKQNATKKLSVAIPKHLHRALKQMALQEDMTMGELITAKLLESLGGELPLE